MNGDDQAESMKAVVLAAGKGERLWPLTENRPKPMIPVANRPILDHVFDALESAGVTEVVLVVGSNRERVQDHIREGQEWSVDISYVVQDQQLGSGHALLQAESEIGGPFVALNGDCVINAELIEDVWELNRETGDPVMSVSRVPEPSQYGVVEFEDGVVEGIEEQPVPELTSSDFINAGVYAFNPDVFGAIRQASGHGEQTLTETIAELVDAQRVRAVQYRGMWLDVSEPWDILSVNDALISYLGPTESEPAAVDESAVVAEASILGDGVTVHPQAAVLRGVTLGDNVSVGPGVILENSVLLSDVDIRAGSVVKDSIVGANTTIGPNISVEGGTTTVVLNDALYDDVNFGALIGDNVEVGANVTIEPGTIVGNDATIDAGAHLSARIEDESHVQRG